MKKNILHIADYSILFNFAHYKKSSTNYSNKLNKHFYF